MVAAKFLAIVVATAAAAIPITLRMLRKKGLGEEPKKED
jgi:hypothetical protein